MKMLGNPTSKTNDAPRKGIGFVYDRQLLHPSTRLTVTTVTEKIHTTT